MSKGTPIKVRFSTVEEFLEELHHDHPAVEDRIVRVSCSKEPLPWYHQRSYPLNVLAGFIVHGKLIELEQPVGILEDESKHNPIIKAHAEEIIQKIETTVIQLKLKPRRGIFEI